MIPTVLGFNLGATASGKRLRDGGACLIAAGRIHAVAEERISRRKHAGGASRAIPYVTGIATFRGIDLVTVSSCCENVPDVRRFSAPASIVMSVDHHLAHAYSAFWPSSFDSAIVVVMDCGGNTNGGESRDWWRWRRQQATYYLGSHSQIDEIGSDFSEPYAVGFGELFRAATHYLGWGSSARAGNTMALAALGEPPDAQPVYGITNGRLVSELRLDPYQPIKLVGALLKSRGLESRPRETGTPLDDTHVHVASFIQESFYRALRWRIAELVSLTGERNVCFAGGVSLNCVAIGRLLREGVVDAVYVQPAAGDTGQCLGAAYAGLHRSGGMRSDVERFTPFLGRSYLSNDVDSALEVIGLSSASLDITEGWDSARRAAAQLIAAGGLVGLFSGRSEFGPRALGGRSILADPRSKESRRRISLLKGRDNFMPCAPSVLEEAYSAYFAGNASETMTVAVKALASAKVEIPAVIHADDTARVQLVDRHPSDLRSLLHAFREVTGIPVLLNTSFNLGGEPIVETPQDAISILGRSRLDAVLFGDRLVAKGAAWMDDKSDVLLGA
jgi:carbamoyltransferase